MKTIYYKYDIIKNVVYGKTENYNPLGLELKE